MGDRLQELWFDGDMLPSSYDGQDCLLARVLDIVGERSTLLVLRDPFCGVRRFSGFHARTDPVARELRRTHRLLDSPSGGEDA